MGVVMVFARIKPVLDMASPILDTIPEIGGAGTGPHQSEGQH